MSSFQLNATGVHEIAYRVTSSTVATIVDASETALFVPWFEVNETNNSTHNLTVDIYDGTNAVYLGDDAGVTWNAKAVNQYASMKFTQGYLIPIGSKLRVTSSDAAGKFHVVGLVGKPY